MFGFQLASALRSLVLLLCCAPLAAHSQLAWGPEPEPLPVPAPQPVSSSLSWGPDNEPTPLVVSDPAPKSQQPLASQPQLSAEDLAALLVEPYSPPSLSGGLPSAYVANWGDFYFVGSTATESKRRDDIDAVFNAGIGFGDDVNLVAVELRWNMASFKNFNSNGSFDVAMGRILVNQPRLQVGMAGGVFDVYAYRQAPSSESIPDPTGFGVITMALPLREPNFRFNQVLQISFGLGGRDFAFLDENFNGPTESLFGSIGVELAPNIGISAGVSGRGTNLNLSYSPFRDLPIAINLLAADVFDQSPDGTVGIFTVSWGDNFRRGLF
jgi:hypothetical protein